MAAEDFTTYTEVDVPGRIEDDGIPFMQVDPRERFIIAAYNGGYQRRKIAATNLYANDPEKNEYSHVMNALEYTASRIFQLNITTDSKGPSPGEDLASTYSS